MAYYSAHYGSWNDPRGVQRVEFGKASGIDYLFHTENYREAITTAQEVATATGQIVHFCKETPRPGRGMCAEWREVYPIRSKIKCVTMYKMYRENWYDVVYHSGRVCTYTEPYLPATVQRFVDSSDIRRERHDSVFHRDEMVYW